MWENYVDFYSPNRLVNTIKNIRFVFALAMDFDRISGHRLSIDLISEIFTNFMLLRKAMHIFVSHLTLIEEIHSIDFS